MKPSRTAAPKVGGALPATARGPGAKCLVARAGAGALAALVIACGSPPRAPAAATAAAPPLNTVPAIVPAAPENPDAAFRYLPPGLGAAPGVQLSVVEGRLKNGLSTRLIETRALPITGFDVILRWRARAPIAGTAALLGATLTGATLPAGRTLREELDDLGAVAGVWVGPDATVVRVQVLPTLLEQALTAVLLALRSGKIAAAELDRARAEARAEARAAIEQEPALDRLDRLAAARFFTAPHPYHDPAGGTAEGLARVTVKDIERFRDAALSPEIVTVAVTGRISGTELSEMAERVAGSWVPTTPARAAPAAAGPGQYHGVFLIEEPSAKSSHLLFAIPMPSPRDPEYPAATVLWELFRQKAGALLAARLEREWQSTNARYKHHPQASYAVWLAETSPGSAAAAADVALRAMEALAGGEISDAELTAARQKLGARGLAFEGLHGLLSILAFETIAGAPAGRSLEWPASTLAVTRSAVLALAGTWFKKDRVGAVATGEVAKEKEAMERLGMGPVTVEKPGGKGGKP